MGAIAISIVGEVALAPERVLDAIVDFLNAARVCSPPCR
jgi:hypothetical protein